MMKTFSVLFVIIGLCLLGFGGYKFFYTQQVQKDTIKKAYKVLNRTNNPDNKQGDPKTVFKPEQDEVVGILSVPRIDAKLPIVEGTDENDLDKGVGHYKGTAYPQQNDQIVLSGHRDTVFRRMGELKIGDILTIKVPYGSFSYKITSTKIVDDDDRTVIKSTAPDEVLTVTTCYPFSFIGNAPKRYIITAKPTTISSKK